MDAKVQMGCHTKETRLFVTQKVQLLSAERSCFMKDKKKISLSPTSFHTSKGPRDSHDFRGRTSYQCITTLRFCSVFFLGNWCQANGIMGLAPDRGSETVLQQIFKECFGGGTPEPRCTI